MGRTAQNADPPSPPRRRVPPPRRESENASAERDYIAENVGFSLYDILKVLGVGLGAYETEVKDLIELCLVDSILTNMSNRVLSAY